MNGTADVVLNKEGKVRKGTMMHTQEAGFASADQSWNPASGI
jgi:hypothetical protein